MLCSALVSSEEGEGEAPGGLIGHIILDNIILLKSIINSTLIILE